MYTRTIVVILALGIFRPKVVLMKMYGGGFNVKQFKQDWCRQRKAALDWKSILAPCERDMEYSDSPKSLKLV